jgi:hypothetical protein
MRVAPTLFAALTFALMSQENEVATRLSHIIHIRLHRCECGSNLVESSVPPQRKYFWEADAWTGESDLLTVSEAPLIIVRDAITRTGEFADDEV